MYYGGKSKIETGLVKPVRASRAIKPKRKYSNRVPKVFKNPAPPAPAFVEIEAHAPEDDASKAVVIICAPKDLRNIVQNVLG